ncbi:MAG TPA: acyl-CoA dehydrogenase [Streptosporangiaceae bacterium]|nr:acyl-CoA dehydrogenase [Streptosporangiaceae bacterium]
MALALTDDHSQLADAVRAWTARICPPSAVRAAADGDDSGAAFYRDTIRPGLAELGVLGLHVPEADGGQGAGLTELAVAIEELGRALLPGSLVPTVLTTAVLASAGEFGKVVASLAQGNGNGAVALTASIHATARPDGDLVVNGSADCVLGAPDADLVILPARLDAGAGTIWVAVDADSLDIEAAGSLDLTRRLGTVTATDLTVPADRQLTGLEPSAVPGLAAVVFCAEAIGIAEWAVATAADYAKLRQQFGRPIGQFQAVKHRCARMLVAAEQAAALVWDAARAMDEHAADTEREFAVAAAAALATEAAVSCVHECIQVLGGIGYTWEHDAHLYYRRAMTLRALLGAACPAGQGWRRRTAALALDGQRRQVRLEIPGGDAGLRASIRSELAEISKLTGADRNSALGAGGWVMPHMPEPWGRGAGALEQLIIDEELRAANIHVPGLAIGAWVVPALIQYGTPEQQQRFLPATLRADYLWCQLFSEPGAGSDLAGLTTRAERVDGGWQITGQKIWTSLARQAAWAICIARTDPAQPRHDGISYFLVDMRSPGIEVRPLREIGGDSFFNQVFLDGVFVPDDCLVGEVNKGWRIARTTLANERVSLARSWTFGCGVPELLQVAGAAAVRENASGSERLAEVGELVAVGQAIELLGLQAALKQLSGTEPGATGSVRKLLSMRHAQQVAELCWELSGAAGALSGRPGGAPLTGDGAPDGAHWARQVLITRALTIGGGTTDVQLNIIGERILGLPRDPDPPGTTS